MREEGEMKRLKMPIRVARVPTQPVGTDLCPGGWGGAGRQEEVTSRANPAARAYGEAGVGSRPVHPGLGVAKGVGGQGPGRDRGRGSRWLRDASHSSDGLGGRVGGASPPGVRAAQGLRAPHTVCRASLPICHQPPAPGKVVAGPL